MRQMRQMQRGKGHKAKAKARQQVDRYGKKGVSLKSSLKVASPSLLCLCPRLINRLIQVAALGPRPFGALRLGLAVVGVAGHDVFELRP